MNQDLIRVQIEQREDDVVVARLTGELDISVAEKTGREIADAVPSPALGVVVDMSELEFMDSSGLRTVALAERRLGAAGRELVLVRGHDTVQRVFSITRMDEHLTFVDDPGSPSGDGATA